MAERVTGPSKSPARHSAKARKPALAYRVPNPGNAPPKRINRVIQGDSRMVLRDLPDECAALAVTSPPYWNVIDYRHNGQIGHSAYEDYIGGLLEVWRETARVLIPNGKLAIVSPIMPIPKTSMGGQHTRHLKNISNDIEASILADIPSLSRYSLFVWQKQTSVKMFGSYPYPPNLYEDNTIEFINVFVKGGKPPAPPKAAREASRITQAQWRNLTMQVWPMYPEDVRRARGHPCPFPTVLPQRLIMMYTFREDRDAGFGGDIVLDPFNGAGATCVAAKNLGRNYIGVDINRDYCRAARERLRGETLDEAAMMLQPVRVRKPVTDRPA